MVPSSIILIIVSVFWLVYTNVANYFSPSNAAVSSNIPIYANSVTIHETGSSTKTKKFLGKEFLIFF